MWACALYGAILCLAALSSSLPVFLLLIGCATGIGVFINAGHGPLGWTFACGSGKLIADLVSGAAPEIDAAPYSLTRLS